MFGKFLGNYLVILYLFIKMLYIANCLGQLFLISVLLGRNYYIYGATIFRDIIQGKGIILAGRTNIYLAMKEI